MKQLPLPIAAAILAAPLAALAGDDQNATTTELKMHPIGHVKKSEDQAFVVLDKQYEAGLLGLDGFSHVYVFWWFDRNDTPQGRTVLRVHPRGNPKNPLTGVFATRSPRRPNLIAMTLCKIVAVQGNTVEVEKIDAFDGTPVLDMKPFLPGYDTADGASVPDWVGR
jgi:tRNA-Thr(GGU) m(6)t(6)A37 methyltransferase TsaA